MKTKIQSMGIVIIILLTAFSCSSSKQEKDSNQGELPNIILLMGDDHGWDEVAYNGHPFVKTPVLDEMAAGGRSLDAMIEITRVYENGFQAYEKKK